MFITIVLLVVILGLLIFVHEFGHFVMAKRTGMGIEEFGFGYPPRVIGIQKTTENEKKSWRIVFKKTQKGEKSNKNTIYSLNWIPFGGFVKIKGEQGDKIDETDSFTSKKIWQRAVVLSAGVIMNIMLAFVLFSAGFMIGLPDVVDGNLSDQANIEERFVQVVQVENESPAANAEMKPGDIIKNVEGEEIFSVDQFKQKIEPSIDQSLNITYIRADEIFKKSVTPVDLNNTGDGKIGAYLTDTGIVSYPWYYSIWMGVKTTFSLTWRIVVAFYEIIKNLIVSHQVSEDIAGPVGIAVLTGQMVKLGFIYVLQFTAILSINLAIINYVPFPALDGGRVLFLIIEKIKGSPINQRIEGIIHSAGFFILISVLLFFTFKDVSRFSESIMGFFNNIL
ncbi:RIP metalloprotease RseP [Patescibacteria group bacterium]|nr:RIP metalloprotease RseP [Patescibacteria group bacterium]